LLYPSLAASVHFKSANMDARDLIEGEAELDDEEAEESYDEGTGDRNGDVKDRANGAAMEDSSEEEEDDDDEEAARAVRRLL
jgi:transcription elongation factor SPT6